MYFSIVHPPLMNFLLLMKDLFKILILLHRSWFWVCGGRKRLPYISHSADYILLFLFG